MSFKHAKILWPTLLTVAMSLGGWAFVAGWPKKLLEPNHTSTAKVIQPGLGARALDPVQNIRFTLYDSGILPRELHLDKGSVSIAIEDRTRQSAGLEIEREVGNVKVPIGQVQRFANHWRGRAEFRLTPGTYTIFDTSRPTNRAKLVVAP